MGWLRYQVTDAEVDSRGANNKIGQESVDLEGFFCELHILAHAVIAGLATRRFNSTHFNNQSLTYLVIVS